MKRQSRILAGTAIGLLMASAPLAASPMSGKLFDFTGRTAQVPLILAQAECVGEDCPEPADEGEQQAPAEAAPEPEPQPAPEPEPEPVPEPEPAPEPVPEPAPEPEQAPAEQPPVIEEPEAAQEAEPQAEPETTPEQAPAEEAPAQEAPTQEAPAEQPQAPAVDAPTQQAPEQPAEEVPAPEAPSGEQPEMEPPATEQPAEGQAPVETEQPTQAETDGQVDDPNAAPILDSQKEEAPAQPGEQPGEQTAQPQPPVDQGPPPESDAAAAEAAQPTRIEAVTAEQGTRRERAPDEDRRRRERPEGVDVVREIGDRIIINIGTQIFVESNDRPRLRQGARDVYYEDLPRGRTRETIVRDNGVQIVTIRNRYGDVIRRSRIMPDGREYVLVYVEDDYYDRGREWRDPGYDLPPMRLTIPRREYILEAEYVQDPDDYYEFLQRPPVERVQRLYSVDEVKRSARVRDIARRVDLDTLTFDFGSASIPESEIRKLEGVASAMERLLERNPAETFLIEGHTDAVGSDAANLALSDRRAEAVAVALTDVFDIPPENLVTQGYGERFLKINTQEPERENRRVAIRRITPLVAPMASAN